MPTSADLRGRVEERLAGLSPAGRRVALLLLDEHDRLGFHSATDLGRMCGTSDATVIRTVQRLGYRGMIDLKAEVAARLTPATPGQRLDASIHGEGASGPDLSEGLVETQTRTLRGLERPEVRAAIGRAAELIGDRDRLAVHAHGVSIGLAAHAAAQFSRIGHDAWVLGSAAGLVGDDLVGLRRSDAVLVFASGRPQPWHEVLYERCAELAAGVVLLTDTQPVPVADAVVVRAGRGDASGLATHIATIAAIERILLAVADRRQDRATAALEELERHRRRLLSRAGPSAPATPGTGRT